MALFLDRWRGATLPHVRGGEDAVAGRPVRSIRGRSAQDALRDAVARHRRRADLSKLQLRGRLHLSVSSPVQMQGLPPTVLGDQRNLARVPEAAVSDAADGFQLVRQCRQGHQQSSPEPLSWAACEDRVRPTAQAAMRVDIERCDGPVERGR